MYEIYLQYILVLFSIFFWRRIFLTKLFSEISPHNNMDDSSDTELGTASSSRTDTEQEVAQIDREVAEISKQIQKLEGRRRILKRKAELLREKIQKEESDALLGQDWESRRFAWSERLDVARGEVFGLSSYRQDQLAVINASMSGHDCLLIMPTGGGKSLTYQLPAVISDGLTLVVSPLISLMEDQVMALTRLGVGAEMLTSTTDQETKKRILKEMLEPSSSLKLLYVTPEKCSKSKQFMAK